MATKEMPGSCERTDSDSAEATDVNDVPKFDPADLKEIGKRLAMKISRFGILAAIYYSYLTLEDIQGVNTYGFPIIYLYLWTGLSVIIGIVLFILGRPTLMDDSVMSFICGSRLSFFQMFCDGTVYKQFCILLNWFYPYVVTTAWGCYCRTKIRHSRFVLYYFAFLILVEMKKLRRLQYFGQMVIISSSLYLNALAGNWWGVAGAVLMMVIVKLVISGNEGKYGSLKIGPVELPRPLMYAMTSLMAAAFVTQSIQVMSGMVDGYDHDLPHITTDVLLSGFKPIFFGFMDTNEGSMENDIVEG